MERNTNIGNYEDYCQVISRSFQKYRHKTAVKCINSDCSCDSITYSQIAEYAKQFKQQIKSIGLKEGNRVLIYSSNNASLLITYLVLSYNHLCPVIADTKFPQDELFKLIKFCDISAAFIDDISLCDFEDFDDIPFFSVWHINKHSKLLRDNIMKAKHYPLSLDTCAILFSSGTGSKIKPVEITYTAFTKTLEEPFKIIFSRCNKNKAFFCLYPFSHISGFEGITDHILQGVTYISAVNPNTESIAAGLKLNPTFFAAIPSIIEILENKLICTLKDKKLFKAYTLQKSISNLFWRKFHLKKVSAVIMKPFRSYLFGNNISTILLGGLTTNKKTISFMRDLGIHVANIYATTEIGLYISGTTTEFNCPYDSVGKYNCMSYNDVKLVNIDTEGVGEIRVKSLQCMRGYYKLPDLTKQAFDKDGYFITGDNGRIDTNGYLYLVGRSKENIILANGKKITPQDLATIFSDALEDLVYSFVGVPIKAKGYDQIHLFIEKYNLPTLNYSNINNRIYKYAKTKAIQYKIHKIHYIDKLPKTTVGKVKYYVLKDIAKKSLSADIINNNSNIKDITYDTKNQTFNEVASIIHSVCDITTKITGKESLMFELGIDSLSMLKISSKIEEKFRINIGNILYHFADIDEIINYINNEKSGGKINTISTLGYNIESFPKKKLIVHKFTYSLMKLYFKKTYYFKIEGLENIEKDQQYIFCPNHLTHLDSFWMLTALGKKAPKLDDIACMGVSYHLNSKLSSFIFRTLGGIPVEEIDNPLPALKKSEQWISNGGSFIIHPEGARSFDGKLFQFQPGAAQLSIKTRVPIIPVVFNGGLEVFPRKTDVLKTKNENGEKFILKFKFCNPIFPESKNTSEITSCLQRTIQHYLEY